MSESLEWQHGHEPVSLAWILGSNFPFKAWAHATRFRYPPEAEQFLSRCDSAAEAFFLRPFCRRSGATYPDDRTAIASGLTVQLQVACAGYRIDVVVSDRTSSLAIEIDGMGFHHKTKEQVASDYLRERRIVLRGHPLIRFTAQEALTVPDKCWLQIEAILEAWGRKR